MLKSIRWTLQLWYGFILLSLLIGFGTALYLHVERSRYQALDAELAGTAHMLANELRPDRRPPRPRADPPPDQQDELFGDLPPDPTRADRPPRRRDGPPGQDDPMAGPEIRITPMFLGSFEGESLRGTYYRIWKEDGSLLGNSPNAPTDVFKGVLPPPPPPAYFRQRDGRREVLVRGPKSSTVLIGRSADRERGELRQLGISLGVTGTGLLAVGLLGGWIVATRAIRPIHAISEAARDISGTNLSRRIDSRGTNSELGALAATLNDMFGRLEQAFDRQVRFTADASHELRTPLSIIYSNTELALSRERSADEYRETLASSFRAAKRMKSLVEGLLVLASADSGKLTLKRMRIDLASVVEECADLVGPLAADRKVSIDLKPGPAEITGDPMRLAQLVTNLMTNAIVYNRPGGKVTAHLAAADGHAVLSIADTGIGVPAEHLPHLFDRFYRTDASRSRESGGTGLGLAICRSIVEAHGGSITVASEPGAGTTFTVRLPMKA